MLLGLDPPFAGVYSKYFQTTFVFVLQLIHTFIAGEAQASKQIGQLSVQENERLFLSIAKANKDVSPFTTVALVLLNSQLYISRRRSSPTRIRLT